MAFTKTKQKHNTNEITMRKLNEIKTGKKELISNTTLFFIGQYTSEKMLIKKIKDIST